MCLGQKFHWIPMVSDGFPLKFPSEFPTKTIFEENFVRNLNFHRNLMVFHRKLCSLPSDAQAIAISVGVWHRFCSNLGEEGGD